MSHNLYLYSCNEEFTLVGNSDDEAPGLGRSTVFSGNTGTVVKWYERHCEAIAEVTKISPLTPKSKSKRKEGK